MESFEACRRLYDQEGRKLFSCFAEGRVMTVENAREDGKKKIRWPAYKMHIFEVRVENR